MYIHWYYNKQKFVKVKTINLINVIRISLFIVSSNIKNKILIPLIIILLNKVVRSHVGRFLNFTPFIKTCMLLYFERFLKIALCYNIYFPSIAQDIEYAVIFIWNQYLVSEREWWNNCLEIKTKHQINHRPYTILRD